MVCVAAGREGKYMWVRRSVKEARRALSIDARRGIIWLSEDAKPVARENPMRDELAYVLITPYSLLKSRTGGIIGRLLFLANLEFVGARLYRPSDEFVDRYIALLRERKLDGAVEEMFVNYINNNFRRNNRLGISNRTLLLLFRGPDAVEHLRRDVVGSFSANVQGDTVRGTYGDYLVGRDGKVEFFEPAVLVGADGESTRKELELLADFARKDGGTLEDAVKFKPEEKPETTLVIIKPDSFKRRSARPGNMIDIFSKTGLFIVGVKLLRFSVAQAEEFYRPLRSMFVERLKGSVEKTLAAKLHGAFGFGLTAAQISAMADVLKEENAQFEFDRIVEYMSGRSSRTITGGEQRDEPGAERCLALLYRGVGAVGKIRERLGSTDPTKAAEGTLRSDLGHDLMKNGAHASDSVESAERERKIVGLWPGAETTDIEATIREYLASGR
jgi:nucleoside diphosphate kinase